MEEVKTKDLIDELYKRVLHEKFCLDHKDKFDDADRTTMEVYRRNLECLQNLKTVLG